MATIGVKGLIAKVLFSQNSQLLCKINTTCMFTTIACTIIVKQSLSNMSLGYIIGYIIQAIHKSVPYSNLSVTFLCMNE